MLIVAVVLHIRLMRIDGMNFFGYITASAIYAQILSGIFTGFFLGIFLPSSFEKDQAVQDVEKVWFWKKYISNYSIFTIKGFIINILKINILIMAVSYVNFNIYVLMKVNPMTKYASHYIFFFIFFLVSTFISKYLRFLYFKWRLKSFKN